MESATLAGMDRLTEIDMDTSMLPQSPPSICLGEDMAQKKSIW
jgi:hypothetical protein